MAQLTTLSNVKAWLGITTSTDDNLLNRLITAASDFIESWTNRTFAQTSYTEYRNGTGGRMLVFANYPVTAVASVSVDGLPVSPSTDPTMPGWVFDDTTLYLRPGVWCFSRGIQNVQVTYTAGFATTPPDIEQACIEMISLRYKERDRIGVASKTLAGEVISFSQKDMQASTQTLLNQWKKVAPV